MLRQKSLLSTTTLSSMKKIKPAPATMSTTFFLKWQIFLFGLFYIIMQCDARAVNVSNTWTMPQEGLSVFYRFFRDRISWFEADAVCQFHHANLVTVDNSFQFDATRDLLRELDVNDIVWIGLMRPQSSDRFMWSSNSRPLVADTGYWAESLPLMDAPLCAVIDPIRDYRWHALRCGGPETASFLCEMPVPNWADACILKDMPNLTMQYMADTASIELIRNCQEEGLLRTSCKGKLDRERAVQDLICPRERLEAQRINDITNSHFKSLQIINSIPTDNNENNDIELLPIEQNYAPAQAYPEELQTEKNTVQKLIEQFNVDELMQADEPTTDADSVSTFYKIPGLIPKPVKKSAKKELEYPKKDVGKSKSTVATTQVPFKDIKKYEAYILDDMMLGDQPQAEHEISEQILNEDVSNEILEPLPHIKKTNIHHKEDMSKMEKEAIAIKESMQKSREMEASKMRATTAGPVTAATSSTAATVIEKNSMAATTTAAVPLAKSSTIISSTDVGTTAAPAIAMDDTTTNSGHHSEHAHNVEIIQLHADTTTTVATIGHPMHPQQPRSNAHNEDSQNHQHIKESTDNSHFIPPMLLVKSHYVPHGHNAEHNNNNGEHKHNVEHDNLETIATATATTTAIQEEHSTSRKHNAMMEETTENALTTAVAGIAATTTATTMPKMMTTSKDVNAEQTAEKSLNTKHQQEEEQQQHKSLVTQDQQLLEQLFKETATEKDIMQTQTSTTQAEQLREQKKLIPATTIKTESDTTLATTTSTFAAAAVKEKQAAEFETTSSSLMQTSTIKTTVEGEKMLLISNANDDELQTTLKQKQLPAHETTRTTTAAASDAQEEDKRETRDLEDTTLRAEAEAAAPTQPKFSTTAVNKHLKLDNEKDISKADKTTATTQRTTFEQGTTISQPLTTTLSGKKEEQLIEQQQQQSVDLQKLKEAKEIETTTIIEQHQETTHAAATQTPQLEYSSDQRQGQDETSEKIKRINLLTKVSTTTTTTTKPIITTATAEETATTTIATLMPSAAINLKQDEQKQPTTIKQVEIQANLEAEADNEQETIGKTTEEAQHTFPITKTPEATTLFPTTIKAVTEQLATVRPTTGNSINISTQVKHAISTATATADASTTLQSTFSSSRTTSAPTEGTTTTTTPITSTTPTSTTTPRPPETTTRNFLKVTTEEPFKPNRHRSLTKPESVSYIKKILG